MSERGLKGGWDQNSCTLCVYIYESHLKHPSTYKVKPEDNELIKIVSTIENLEPMLNANTSQNHSVGKDKAIKELDFCVRLI